MADNLFKGIVYLTVSIFWWSNMFVLRHFLSQVIYTIGEQIKCSFQWYIKVWNYKISNGYIFKVTLNTSVHRFQVKFPNS